MTKILLSGCYGKMGKIVVELIQENQEFEIIGGVDKDVREEMSSFPVFQSFQEVNVTSDVIIDFSHHSLVPALLDYVEQTKTPAVICTTGLDDQIQQRMKQISESVPVFRSPNMSLGINLLLDLVKKAASVLQDGFDVEIIEKHHNRKIDAPSGTAYMIAETIKTALDTGKTFTFGRHGKSAKRQENEIGIHAVRGGTIVGEHSVLFAGVDEILEIKHTCASRRVFGLGALKAAAFLVTQEEGLYTMNDMLS